LKMRRPAEKEMFQSKISKSYKDMLSALKEGFSSDAQRKAAFASGYKEKGKKKKEEVEIDEGTKQVLAHGGKGKYKVTKDGDKIEIKFGGKVVGTADFDRGADSFFVSMKGEKGQKSFDDAQAIADYFAKNKITEELDLDEDYVLTVKDKEVNRYKSEKDARKAFHDLVQQHGHRNVKVFKEEVDLDESVIEQLKSLAKGGSRYKPKSGAVEIKDDKGKVINKLTPEGAKKVLDKMKDPISGKSSVPDRTRGGAEKKIIDIVKNFKEEADLEEGKMKELHGYIQDGKTAEQIAKLMKLDVKTIKALMNSHYPEEVELD